MKKLEELQKQLDEIKRKEEMTDDFRNGKSSAHIINLIIVLQDVCEHLKFLDHKSIKTILDTFQQYLNKNLQTLSSNMVETAKALSMCDMSAFGRDLEMMRSQLANLEKITSMILKRKFIVNISEVRDKEMQKMIDDDVSDKLNMKIEELNLSIRSTNLLKGKFKDVREMIMTPEHQLRKIPAFGRKCMQELKNKLSEIGLSLGMRISEDD